MKALVVYGSKHGSTRKIAERISSVLENDGSEVELSTAKEALQVERYDLVIVGSGIYLGSWMKEPIEFLRENQEALKTRPVWMFSSGLHPEDPRSANPKIVSESRGIIKPRDHRFFSGSLDPKELGRLHRALLRLPLIRSRFPIGDFRDWEGIEAWAEEIAQSLDSFSAGREEEIERNELGIEANSSTSLGHPTAS